MDGDKKDAASQPQQDAGWQYKAEDPGKAFDQGPADPEPAGTPVTGSVEWSASEFVAHEKGFGWYAALMLGAVLIAAGLYFITRDRVAAAVVVIMAIILAIIAARPPRTINYRVNEFGLTAGNKFYPYKAYKSFAMPDDGPFASVVLIPLKRFDFPISAYLAPDSQRKVLETLSNHLPLEPGRLDAVEQFMRQLRF